MHHRSGEYLHQGECYLLFDNSDQAAPLPLRPVTGEDSQP